MASLVAGSRGVWASAAVAAAAAAAAAPRPALAAATFFTPLAKSFPSPLSLLPTGLAGQVRYASYPGLRPRKTKYQKAMRGFFPLFQGGSLRGTTLLHGRYGLRTTEGGILEDKQLDAARTLLRRALKPEKSARFFLRVFPDRPVSRKAAEVRMGKGKGAVDHFSRWVGRGRVVAEVRCSRRDLAAEALRIASEALPITTEFCERPATGVARTAPRCLPHFLRRRFAAAEFADVVAARRASLGLPSSARSA
ncbi:mitochondrial ribosomal large subunit component [Cladochytrium tenue]|nr:mitochondrial ribosomal large subunit component [Cladochytrium tenue]